jgi:hypothetical protein
MARNIKTDSAEPGSGEPRQERVLEVTRLAPAPDLSYIPEVVVEAFAAAGYRVFLASNLEQNVALMSTRERHPLLVESIPSEELQKIFRQGLYGFRVQPDGSIRKGDCLIYVQPIEAFEHYARQDYADWARQDSPESVLAEVDELNQMIMAGQARGSVRPMPDSSLTLSEHSS